MDEGLCRLLVEGVADHAIFMLDPSGRVLTWNLGAERITQYAADEVIGKKLSFFYPDEELLDRHLQAALADGRLEDEGLRVRKDASRFWAEVVITPLRDADGQLRGFAHVASDVSVSRHAKERLRLLLGSIKDYAIFMLDVDGTIATWNLGAEKIKQYSAAEAIGKHFSMFYPRADVAAGKPDAALRVAATAGRYEEEGWRLRKDGSRFWADVVISAVRDDDGTLVGYAKVTRDLSEHREAEERLRQSEEKLRLLVDSISDYAVYMLDTGGRIATWNRGAELIKGYTAPEIIGRHFSAFYPEEAVKAGIPDRALRLAAVSGRFEDEGWRVRKDGSRFLASVVISAVHDHRGALVGFAKVTRDLSERKRMIDERAARRAAEAANEAKDEFLAILGHELRNPLAPIVTALELMRQDPATPASKEREIIERQVMHMVRLIDDLLDVSRISRGKVDLQNERFDLRSAVAKGIEIAQPLIAQRRHQLRVDVSDEALLVHGDEARLAQVAANLLTNAAKYTPPGGHIVVAARREDAEIVLEVADDGAGIAPDLLPRIFELFVQGSRSADLVAGGLGVGLSLVRSLVKVHGGRVEARSPGPGAGSTFTVRLPAAEPGDDISSGSPLTVSTSSERCNVLVVDDNQDALELVAKMLRAAGHQVETADDAVSALSLVQRFRPDIAFVDIGLPTIDGYELALRLRAQVAGQLKVIALTGYSQPHDHERSKLAGFDGHLVKPVDARRLLESIAQVRAQASS